MRIKTTVYALNESITLAFGNGGSEVHLISRQDFDKHCHLVGITVSVTVRTFQLLAMDRWTVKTLYHTSIILFKNVNDFCS